MYFLHLFVQNPGVAACASAVRVARSSIPSLLVGASLGIASLQIPFIQLMKLAQDLSLSHSIRNDSMTSVEPTPRKFPKASSWVSRFSWVLQRHLHTLHHRIQASLGRGAAQRGQNLKSRSEEHTSE